MWDNSTFVGMGLTQFDRYEETRKSNVADVIPRTAKFSKQVDWR